MEIQNTNTNKSVQVRVQGLVCMGPIQWDQDLENLPTFNQWTDRPGRTWQLYEKNGKLLWTPPPLPE